MTGVAQPLQTAVEHCADAVVDTFGAVFARIDGWRAELERFIDESHSLVGRSEVDGKTESLVVPHLATAGGLIIGAGFVTTPGYLSDAEWHLAWWLGHANTFGVGADNPAVRRLHAVEDPSSEEFRDYTTLEWWRVPARSGRRHITGPYVDYLCTDEYTLTLTAPVMHGTSMAGVVGADLYVNDIERMLLPRVRAIAGPATIVNAAGRVVVSTDPHRATGTVLRTAADSALAAVPCGDTGLSLLVDQPMPR